MGEKYFLYYIINKLTGSSYWTDEFNRINCSGKVPLKHNPLGWDTLTFSVERNKHYLGFNRSFTNEFSFVLDGADIIRHLMYLGTSIQQNVGVLIERWNEDTDEYETYATGMIDLSNVEDTVAESVKVNILSDGLPQMLKAYEKTVFSIPCDGSIPENKKVILDGITVQDTANFSIPKFRPMPYSSGFCNVIPCEFQSETSDSYGVTIGSPTLDTLDKSNPFAYDAILEGLKGGNYIFSSIFPTRVFINGYINIRTNSTGIQFNIAASTSNSKLVKGYPRDYNLDYSVYLVSNQPNNGTVYGGVSNSDQYLIPNKTYSFSFNEYIDLGSNCNLFIYIVCAYSHGLGVDTRNVDCDLTGSISLTFNSKNKDTSAWGMTGIDVYNKIVNSINELSSQSAQKFKFLPVSDFLSNKLNLFLTSGDSLRASGDPTYLKYYNAVQSNQYNNSYQFINFFYTLGPVLKISLSDLFDMLSTIYCLSLGTEFDEEGNECLFLEPIQKVYDLDNITLELGEVSNLKISQRTDDFFTTLDIGYNPQNYDDKKGKYEYNTKLSFQSPINTIPSTTKTIISKLRTDVTGIELTRFNNGSNKGSTYNSSDNSVFGLDVDPSDSTFDTDYSNFTAIPIGLPNTTIGVNNGNVELVVGINEQPIYMPEWGGTYLRPQDTTGVFVIATPCNYKTVTLSYYGISNGLKGETCTIKLFYNGNIVASKVYTITSAILNIGDAQNKEVLTFQNNVNFLLGDVIHSTIETSGNCTATISGCTLTIGTNYFIASNVADNIALNGTPIQILEMPNVSPTTINPNNNFAYANVMNSFSVYVFNENLLKKGFTTTLRASGLDTSSKGLESTIQFYFLSSNNNGRLRGVSFFGDGKSQTYWDFVNSKYPLVSWGEMDYYFGDILFATASVPNGCYMQISGARIDLTSTEINVHNLRRVQYDYVSGIPTILGKTDEGKMITTGTGAYFNIEEFTPKRMLMNNAPILASALYNLNAYSLNFLSADKNQYLGTSKDGVDIIESQNISINELGAPLYYNMNVSFETKVPYTFKYLMDNSVNGHIHFTYNGVDLYMFSDKMTVQDVMNNTQTWSGVISSKTNLADLTDLYYSGLNELDNMGINDISFSILLPMQFVPITNDSTGDNEFKPMDSDLYMNRLQFFMQKPQPYFIPWQQSDTISLQCITGGCTPPSISVIDCSGYNHATYTWNKIDFALSGGKMLYELNIPLNNLDEGIYYLCSNAATGIALMSEGFMVKAVWEDTLLITASNTRNKLKTIYSTGYNPTYRIHGWISDYVPSAKFTTYEDEPANITLLNSLPYNKYTMYIGCPTGVPDYVARMVNSIMLLDTVFISGVQFTREADAQIVVENIDTSYAMNNYTLDIREYNNNTSVTFKGIEYDASGMMIGILPTLDGIGDYNDSETIKITDVG